MRSRSGGRGEHAHGVVDALGQGEPAREGGVPQASQLLLRPVRGSGTDISAIISRESPILPGRWPVRSCYAGASRSPLCPARTRRAAGRTSGTGPSPVDVGRVGGDIHGIGFPPRPHGSRYLSCGLAAIGVSLPRTGFVAYQAWTDLTAPSTRSRSVDLTARSRGARHCAELTTPRCLPGPPAGSTASSRRGDDDQFRPDALCGGAA